jgi:hypothetical protein
MLVISGGGAMPVAGGFTDTIVLVDEVDELGIASTETAVVMVADDNGPCKLPPELLLPLLDYKSKEQKQSICTGIAERKRVYKYLDMTQRYRETTAHTRMS